MKNNFSVAGKPVSRLFLGLCPVVAAAAGGTDGLVLGIVMLAVLICSGILMTLIGKLLPEDVETPAAILIICLFTGIAQLLLNMLLPAAAARLGIFIPLCAVGSMLCLLPCKSAYAVQGIKSGIASCILLTVIGVLRELIASGSVFGATLIRSENAHVLFAAFPAGAFILLGILLGIIAAICNRKKEGAK